MHPVTFLAAASENAQLTQEPAAQRPIECKAHIEKSGPDAVSGSTQGEDVVSADLPAGSASELSWKDAKILELEAEQAELIRAVGLAGKGAGEGQTAGYSYSAEMKRAMQIKTVLIQMLEGMGGPVLKLREANKALQEHG